jgi:hypothetical protein
VWDKVAKLNVEAAALGYNNDIQFGPGVQLTKDVGGQTVTAGITAQVADLILEERRSKIIDSVFMPCKQPILPDPVQPTPRGKTGPRSKTVEATRRSSRQKAQACSVPVSKRAAHRLIRAFGMVEPSEQIGEEAMEAYVRSFDTPMTEQAVKAVRRLTSLDSGPAILASAQMAAAEGGASLEEMAE